MSVASILQALAENAGQAELRKGAVYGNLLHTVGQIPGQIVADREQAARLARTQAIQDEQLGFARNREGREASDHATQEQQAALAQKRLATVNAGLIAAMGDSGDPSKFDAKAAFKAVSDLGDPAAIQDVIAKHQSMQPKLLEHDPTKALRTDSGEIVVQPTAKAPKTQAELAADAADPKSPTQSQSTTALDLLRPPKPEPTPRPLEQQLLEAITTGDTFKVGQIKQTLVAAAQARRDPDAAASARALAGLRADEARARLVTLQEKNQPLDISPDVQTTRSGKTYIDLSQYSAGERDRARKAAADVGAVPLSKEQANALQEIDNARANQQSISDQIGDLLPKTPAGRGAASLTVPLQKLFQTNDQIAAYNSWRTAAIQTLRATAGSKGLRINQAEIAQAIENDIPKLTDTVGVAQQKLKNINTLLDNAEGSIVVRDRTPAPPALQAGSTQRVMQNGVTYEITTDASGKVIDSKVVK